MKSLAPQIVTLHTDLQPFTGQVSELATRLKALDPAESLFCRIRGDIEECLAVGGDQLIRLEGRAAPGADKVLVKVELGPILQKHLTALRAVQGDCFGGHGGVSGEG